MTPTDSNAFQLLRHNELSLTIEDNSCVPRTLLSKEEMNEFEWLFMILMRRKQLAFSVDV